MTATLTIPCPGLRTQPSTGNTRRWPPTPLAFISAGRLATYKYYNMDQVVAQALTLCAKLSGATRGELVRKPARFEPLPEPALFRSEAN